MCIRDRLEITQKGAVKNNRHNCKLILEHDSLLKGVFRYNILTEQTDLVKPVWWERISPAFTDMDLNYIMPVSYTHLDVYKRQDWCIQDTADSG